MSDWIIIIGRSMNGAVVIINQKENNEWLGHYDRRVYEQYIGYNSSERRITSGWAIMIKWSMIATVVITILKNNNGWLSCYNIYATMIMVTWESNYE